LEGAAAFGASAGFGGAALDACARATGTINEMAATAVTLRKARIGARRLFMENFS